MEGAAAPSSCKEAEQRASPLWDHSLSVGCCLAPPLVHTLSPCAEMAARGPLCALLLSAVSEGRPA